MNLDFSLSIAWENKSFLYLYGVSDGIHGVYEGEASRDFWDRC